MTTHGPIATRADLGIRPGSFAAWVLAARPKTLPVAFAPVAVGTSVAYFANGVSGWGAAVAALLGALFLQIGTNFANDYFDARSGADNEERIGPPRAVQSGLLSGRVMAIGTAVAFGMATLTGVYLTWLSGWPIVAIGAVSVLSGVAYTGGPYPLGYNGLGDLFVFVFFGLVATSGTAFVASGSIPAATWLAGASAGALATTVLVVNNVRDAKGDREVGKRTLVARFGRRFGELEYAALLGLAAASIALVPILGLGPWPVLAALFPLALGVKNWRTLLSSRDGETLNQCLADSAKVMLMSCLLMAAGFAVGKHVP